MKSPKADVIEFLFLGLFFFLGSWVVTELRHVYKWRKFLRSSVQDGLD